VPARSARAQATLYRDFVVTQAARLGVTPQEFDERYKLRVVKGDGDAPLRQLRTDTPEFRAWFGDSKVVDEQGAPLVVYHGTAAEFEEFDTIGGTRSGFGKGSHFASDPQIANAYSAQWQRSSLVEGVGERSIPVHLNIRNPFNAGHGEKYYEFAGDRGLGGDHAAIREALIAEGYDGVRYIHPSFGRTAEGPSEAWVAFHSTQIKSVNNRGTFDPTDPNILRQLPAGVPESVRLPVGMRLRSVASIAPGDVLISDLYLRLKETFPDYGEKVIDDLLSSVSEVLGDGDADALVEDPSTFDEPSTASDRSRVLDAWRTRVRDLAYLSGEAVQSPAPGSHGRCALRSTTACCRLRN
jgi:hypothetical protein